MTLRVSRILDFTQVSSQFSTLQYFAAVFYRMVVHFYFWNNICWLPWHHTLLFFCPPPQMCLFSFTRACFSSSILSVGRSGYFSVYLLSWSTKMEDFLVRKSNENSTDIWIICICVDSQLCHLVVLWTWPSFVLFFFTSLNSSFLLWN